MAGRNKQRGFTLIEMVIVIAIMLILISVAVPAYNRSIIHARESVLKQDLFQLRSLISQYTLDKQKAPQSLDDLVSAGYLKQIPKDPFTDSADWTTEQEDDTIMDPSQTESGIDDVHSASEQSSSDGTAYSTW
ncbi:MAG TPA: type II secretion system protein [Terriglobales bacterium]|jgi:general secretion pathway protein G